MVSSVTNPRRLGRQAIDVIFRAVPLGRGRIRRDKSSSPSLLKPSLKVERNSAHGKLRVTDRPRLSPQRACSIKVPPRSQRDTNPVPNPLHHSSPPPTG